MKAVVLCAIFLGAVGLPPARAAVDTVQARIRTPPSRNDETAANKAQALFDQGMVLEGQGRAYDAIGDYSAALAIMPGMARARSNRAGAYLRLGQYAQARADYLTLLEKGAALPAQCYFSLAQIAELQGDRDAARTYYAKAIAADSSSRVTAKPFAAPNDDGGTIMLHPPGHVVRTDERVVLKPPPSHREDAARTRGIILAGYKQVDRGIGLRPAIGVALAGPQIQLGAWREKDRAIRGWNNALALAGNKLAGFTPYIQAVDLPGKGRYYRLRITTVNQAAARRLCTQLHDKGQACILVGN